MHVKLVPKIYMWPSDHNETVRRPICHNFLKVVPTDRLSAHTSHLQHRRHMHVKTTNMAGAQDVAHETSTRSSMNTRDSHQTNDLQELFNEILAGTILESANSR